jgi:hypothetical protein
MGDAEESVKKTHFLSLYPKIFDYSLGGYYHRERWARTRRNFYVHERVKKAKEDLESAITTIGREYIYIKSRMDNPKIFRTETAKQGCNV